MSVHGDARAGRGGGSGPAECHALRCTGPAAGRRRRPGCGGQSWPWRESPAVVAATCPPGAGPGSSRVPRGAFPSPPPWKPCCGCKAAAMGLCCPCWSQPDLCAARHPFLLHLGPGRGGPGLAQPGPDPRVVDFGRQRPPGQLPPVVPLDRTMPAFLAARPVTSAEILAVRFGWPAVRSCSSGAWPSSSCCAGGLLPGRPGPLRLG